jgi:hypothetical protein
MIRMMATFVIAMALVFSISEEAPGLDDFSHNRAQGPCSSRQTPRGPECGIELTCAGGPVRLGESGGACFRASCPGVWGILHERTDQASFRRRIFTYRHFAYKGYWELKDQGLLESGPVPQRALFMVLPDDLIEFRLLDTDPRAKIDVSELGYIKKGSVAELQLWLAYRVYMDNKPASFYRPEP